MDLLHQRSREQERKLWDDNVQKLISGIAEKENPSAGKEDSSEESANGVLEG
jgi:hypothetical protein